ncbi:MAG: toll/interleukin-1 receptor domain-containing protein [Micropepsaceae bacterium]
MHNAASGFRYRAFISYSHRDAADADWLHKAVERYRVPRALVGRTTPIGVVPARLTPLFRDREELAASSDLSAVITTALQAASHLVVLCSPRAARSKWVNEEILAFKRLGRADRIFAIIVDGEPGSGDPDTECFPEALRFQLGADGDISRAPAEPVAADARETGDGRDNAKLKLIAGLIGVGLDDLKRRELQAQRRRTLIAYGLSAVFAVLALAAVWFAITAAEQRARAEAGETEAVTQRDRANAAVDAARTTATVMVTDFSEKLRTAPGAQVTVTAEILDRAITLLDLLAKSSPLGPKELYVQAVGLIRLSQADNRMGETDRAIEEATRAIAILKGIETDAAAPSETRADLATAYDVLGNAYRNLDRRADALKAYREAERRRIALAAEAPDDRHLSRALEFSHRKIADILENTGDYAGARKSLEAAVGIAEALDPGWKKDEVEMRLDLPGTLGLFGSLLSRQHAGAQADAPLQRALDLMTALAGELPDDTSVQYAYGGALSGLAWHIENRDPARAHDLLRQALPVREQLYALDAANMVWAQDLYRNYADLANLSSALNRKGHALYYIRRAISVLEAMVAVNDAVPVWSGDLETFKGWEAELIASGATEEAP